MNKLQLLKNVDENIKKQVIIDEKPYCIISVDIQPEPTRGSLFRSVIMRPLTPMLADDDISVATNGNSGLLCFSQPKSIPYEEFQHKYSFPSKAITANNDQPDDPLLHKFFFQNNYLVSETIEGTMINLWWNWNAKEPRWEISTKKGIGGNYYYFRNPFSKDDKTVKQKTFRQMFAELLGDPAHPEFGKDALGGESGSQNRFYSFVIQHPENHIVHNIIEPSIYLVSVYEKIDNWKIKYIPQTTFQQWNGWNTRIKFPKIFKSEPSEMQVSMGIMITNTSTGERTKIENEQYTYLKHLRGNHPNCKFKYYELIQYGQLNEYLYYFPQYTRLFHYFLTELNETVKTVYWYYVNKYFLKNTSIIGKIQPTINYHINHLHHVYLKISPVDGRKMRETQQISVSLIYNYMFSLSVQNILRLLEDAMKNPPNLF